MLPCFVPWNAVNFPTLYVHVQKEVREIPYAPIVVQATRVVTITVLMELSFVKENLTLESKTQELVIENIECTSCCTGYKGCYYFGLDGKFVCEGKRSEPKICTQQCDPKVAYMICPSSGSTKLLTHICVNCCTAKAGCKLYGHDGSLLCTGEPKIH
ncbi:hypothetical protein H5410_017649 [Solanum commersonii]|uniref:Proteinase inhibitor type-2 CEVI57 n=1 Tax=Solanum commersonii TaxID=4109 RepID=A0A9J5ZZW6_SOLCO|nr:hypothetical protein H5410_017649 [Solanum commersonii]